MPSPRYDTIGQAMRATPVRKKIAQVADRLAGRVGTIAQQEGADVQITREDGTRPKGRPYARVAIPAADEHGDSTTPRRRILGRAVRGG